MTNSPRAALALLVVAALAAGCGGNDKAEEARQQAAEAQKEAAQTQEQAAQQAAQGLEAMARGLEKMAGGGDGGAKAVEPVSFRELMAILPELDGWEKQKPTGERMTSPVPFSQAEGRYTKGDASIAVKIIDSGFNQLLLAPAAMFLAAGYERESSEGHEKSAKVNGQPGWEKWNSENKDGEVNALVGKRFLVTLEGNAIEDVAVLHAAANKMDLAKLAALK
jgi:hypothetical protein